MSKIISFFIATCCFFYINAQIQEGGIPLSKTLNANQRNIPSYHTAEINLGALQQEDLVVDQYKDIPWRYGYIFYVDINILEEGEMLNLPNFDRITRYKVASNHAQTINLTFNHYHLEKGARLFIYTSDYKHVIGAFTEKNNKESGYLTTTLVEGDELIIELYEPNNTIGQNQLNLERIVNGYRSLDCKKQTKAIGDSGPCNNNVICPEGDPWREQIRAVGMLVVQNNASAGFCSGALINNTCENGSPLFLTANHCMQQGNPATFAVSFNFESTDCVTNTGPYPNNLISGTNLLASNAGSDFALLELSAVPPSSYNVFYAGWDKSGNIPSNQTCIHHPSGDLKKITFDYNAANAATWGNPSAQVWHIAAWDDGTTEGGSSGSPLFNQDKRIIGQLFGGTAACNNNVDDYFGRFDVSWDNGSGPSDELQSWLNPLNLNIQQLDGYDPNAINFNQNAVLVALNCSGLSVCGEKLPVEFILKNKGTQPLTSAEIVYGYSGNLQTYQWTGLLNSNEFELLNVDSLVVNDGSYVMQAYISSSNLTDENVYDDTILYEVDFNAGISVEINLTTNYAPTENSIFILDADSNVIEQESSFGSANSYSFNYCLPTGYYCIKITDSGNNGLSPTFIWDQGNYQLIVNGEEIVNTDNIGSEYTYCVEYVPSGIKTNKIVGLQIFPNPSKGMVVIEANEHIQNIEVFDVLGKRIYMQAAVNAKQLHINLSEHNKGVYFIAVETEKGKAIEKVILN